MRGRKILRNILGAFADAAVLLPILALLSERAGFSSVRLLLSAGVAYILAAFVFRVPMSVQPLKSIAVAAITVGASYEEVRWSGFLLGSSCLLLNLLRVDRIACKVPPALIHQLQVGLGVLLVLQGVKAAGEWEAMVSSLSGILILCAALAMVLWPEVKGVPLLGLLATLGLLISMMRGERAGVEALASAQSSDAMVRPRLVAELVLPQIVLTLANSVLATRDVCVRYFGEAAKGVTLRRLLTSIGVGNALSSFMGGLPFCHGSGGVTAHFRGGSTKPWSTAFMGGSLLLLALVQGLSGTKGLSMPAAWVASLLMATGIFHLQLAASTWSTRFGRVKLLIAAGSCLLTRNLLWVLGIAIVLEAIEATLEVSHDSISRST